MKALDPALAAKFIEKFSNVFPNNINIMDQKGMIIGSKDSKRIGNFHEVAYSLIHENNAVGDVTNNDSFLGTKEGVNYIINYKNKPIGVVGVSGKVNEVRSMGLIIKTAIESMLEYEFQLETERQQHNRIEQFLYSIIYNEDYNPDKISAIATSLHYKTDCIRIPILIHPNDITQSTKIVPLLKQCDEATHQDIIAILKNNLILVFKYLKCEKSNTIASYKEETESYIESFHHYAKSKIETENFSFSVGTLQNSFKHYKEAFQHVSWLDLKIKTPGNITFFYNYASDYLKSLATVRVYDEMFHIFNYALSEEKQQLFVEIYGTLIKHNYNVVTSAKELFVHRNTLLFRMNKMNELLNFDPINNYQDRELIRELVYYYKNK